jgi:hypothetical protein
MHTRSWLRVAIMLGAMLLQPMLAAAAPQAGWWGNPAEPGRGFFIESQDGITFLGAYLYDADGHATWLVSGGPSDDPYSYTGQLFTFGKGQTLFGDYVLPRDPVAAGTVAVTFSDDTHATLTWPGGTVAIERTIFGGTGAVFQPFTGWWWNADESGSGYSLEVQGSSLFIVGFMYDDGGRPVWYLSSGPMSSETTYSGAVLLFANGQTMGGSYRPPGTPVTVATLDIEFTATNDAIFTFTESSGASAARFKAGRSKTKKATTQFPKKGTYVPPKGFNGSFSVDAKVHQVVEKLTEDNHFVHQLGLNWLPINPGSSSYSILGVAFTLTYDDVQIDKDDGSTCIRHGSASGPVTVDARAGVFLLDVTEYQKYVFTVSLVPGGIAIPITVTCTYPGGQVKTTSGEAAPGVAPIEFSGVIVDDKIKGGGTKTETFDAGGVAQTVTITFDWLFTAVR